MARDIVRTHQLSGSSGDLQPGRCGPRVLCSFRARARMIRSQGRLLGRPSRSRPRNVCEMCQPSSRPRVVRLKKVASATVILLEESDFAGMNEEWVKWFPVDPPARQGAKLPVRVPGFKVSIALIAEA